MDDQGWFQDLLDFGKEQLGGIRASGEVAGFDVTLGQYEGPPWPLVAIAFFALALIAVFRS